MFIEILKKFFPVICIWGLAFLIKGFSSISKKYVPSKSKYSRWRICSVVLLTLGIIIMVVLGSSVLTNRVNLVKSSSSTANGFTIEEYKIVIDVNEKNSLDVKEYITVDFYEKGHHGIYRFIPTWLVYTNKDGVRQSRESKLSNLKAVGDEYTIDTVSGKQRIKIGDSYYTLPIGNHTYEIDYTYDMGFDPYENFDEFIFHAFGDYWGTEIKNASVIINFPKSFDSQNNVKFFADKYRKKDISSYVNYDVQGSTIYVNLLSNYSLNSALTIDVELPDGYFVNANNNYGVTSMLLCVTCILFSILTIILWRKHGKDLNNFPKTVEFYPPEGLDAAEIGYLYKKDTGRKLSIALIIQLASKGLIQINASEEIVKYNANNDNKSINREIKITKLKDYVPPLFDKHHNATKIMEKYFPNDINENVVISDFGDFYVNSKYLVDNGYIKIESDSINHYLQGKSLVSEKELEVDNLEEMSKISANEQIVYNKLFEDSDRTFLSSNYTFYKVFKEVGENVRNSFDDKINDLVSYRYMFLASLGFLVCTILLGLAYCKFEDLNPKYNIIYTMAFISNITTFVFAILMKRKNSYGEQIKSKIDGFKNYIELAEKDQLEMLVEQNPKYFYDILPYAYVLGVSKKWVEKFENIPIPSNDMGSFDYYNIDSLDLLSDSVYFPPSSSSSSSSGSSGCGGGCSSCGGGCSSCGGGGSW